MRKRMIWGLAALIILMICTAFVLLMLKNRAEIAQLERDTAAVTEMLRQRDAQAQAEKSENANGHFHDDGTFHTGEHNPFDTPTWQTPAVQMPENVKDPAVVAAWKRLEDISNNRQRWGNFSPRALELMAELTPVPSIYDTTEGEDCGGEFIPTLDELAKLRDPRSAELLLAYQMDSGVSGNPPHEALRVMGPAAVPALIARLDYAPGEDSLFDPLDLLPQIVASHRLELDDIVEHIIIPKIKAIVTYEGPGERVESNKQLALNALEAILQKPKSQ
ncbi:hypothetical protein C6501_10690 [Candidatus Poribacteria bacterium]|nr:MAG: hypothetical protein C6501_10690 [Candidatus Poribacteria bacterium]